MIWSYDLSDRRQRGFTSNIWGIPICAQAGNPLSRSGCDNSFLALIGGSFTSTPVQAAPPKTASISGRVTAAGTNEPLEGLEVVLHAWDKEDGLYFERGSVFTDEDGEYSFTGLTAGRFKVQVDCKGSRFLSQWWADTDAGSMDAGGAKRITLSAGQNRTGLISAQVGAVVSGV